MARPDPLLLVTLLGLAGAGLLATAFPDEAFDPDDPHGQSGRRVHAVLVVTETHEGDGWIRGDALAVRPAAADGSLHPKTWPWLWFRPGDQPPAAGDVLHGRVLIQRDDGGHVLVLDGPNAAGILRGDRPHAVRWADLLEHAEAYEGRPLLLLAVHRGDALESTDGAARCMVSPGGAPDDASTSEASVWPIVLERHPAPLGWRCRAEATAP